MPPRCPQLRSLRRAPYGSGAESVSAVTSARSSAKRDARRPDARLDFACRSVEISNVCLLHTHRQRNPDQQWVHLCLKPNLLALKTTKFAPVNAASQLGTHINDGIDGFSTISERRLPGSRRRKNHPPDCPTDLQAAVFVKDSVPLPAIDRVVVESGVDAHRLELLIDRKPSLDVQPRFSDKDELPRAIRAGLDRFAILAA